MQRRRPLALAGLTLALATPSLARDVRPPASWRAQLQAELGEGEVAVLCGKGGVRVVGAGKALTLTSKDAAWCYADGYGDVVWFGAGDTVYAFDLLARNDPVRIATGVLPRVAIRWAAPGAPGFGGGWENETHWTVLVVDEQKVAVVEGNFSFNLDEGQLARDQRRWKLVGKAFRARVAKRSRARKLGPRPASPYGHQCPHSSDFCQRSKQAWHEQKKRMRNGSGTAR